MTILRKPAILGIGVAVLTTSWLGACGGDDPASTSSGPTSITDGSSTEPSDGDPSIPSSTGSAVEAAVIATLEAGSARIAFTSTGPTDGASAGIELGLNGLIEFDSGDADMLMDMGAAASTTPGALAALEVRVVDGIFYLNMGSMFASLPDMPGLPAGLAEMEWVKMDEDAASDPAYEDANPNTWVEALTYLFGASETAEVGQEDLDGVGTTHYTANVTQAALEAGLAATGAALPAHIVDVFESVAADFDTDLPIHVWVDESGRVAKVEFAGHSEGSLVTLKISDYGTAVDVQAPDGAITFAEFQSMTSGFS